MPYLSMDSENLQIAIEEYIKANPGIPLRGILSGVGVTTYQFYKTFPKGLAEFLPDRDSSYKKHSKEELRSKVIDFIKGLGRYATLRDVREGLKVSNVTLKSYGINTKLLNEELGFGSTNLGASNSLNIDEGVEKLKDLILSENRYISAKELRTQYKVSESLLRYIDLPALYNSVGITHLALKRKFSDKDLAGKVTEIISQNKRYTSEQELGEILGISANTISYRNISVEKLNLAQGFRRQLKGFEYRVIDMLKIIFPTVAISTQVYLKNCVSDKGRPLFFDIHLPELNLLIECDGPSHNDRSYIYFSEEVVKRDKIKDNFCRSEGIILCRIPYKIAISIVEVWSYVWEALEKNLTTAQLETVIAKVSEEVLTKVGVTSS